ncbi:hypothetical protein H7E67_01890 [Clostridium gasigenes]|uniref:hypothetical protein n=1 Tax=Clostridium gasigenes TaxID=94869 RepID=UPI00162ACBB1|nr:hypothetical protein [Clostridium gasigenes]MBB6622171.1 hypothetical protein [Clostridium gasigenes]
MPSDAEYHKNYKREERKLKKETGLTPSMVGNVFPTKFSTKKLKVKEFKKHYELQIDNKEQQIILQNCINLIDLINMNKEFLEQQGLYTTNISGIIRPNPASKELRDTLKSFTIQLRLLQELLGKKETNIDLNKWLDD